MKTEHTPGPWHINGYAYNRDDAAPAGRRVYICSADSSCCEGYTINASNVQVCDIKRHTRLGDALLIAAAPELLEALRNLLAYANKYSDTMAEKLGRGAEELGELADSSSVAGMARAAIAKAMGGDHA